MYNLLLKYKNFFFIFTKTVAVYIIRLCIFKQIEDFQFKNQQHLVYEVSMIYKRTKNKYYIRK